MDWEALTALATFAVAVVSSIGIFVAFRAARRQEEWRRKTFRPQIAVFAMTAPPDCVRIPCLLKDLKTGQVVAETTSYYLLILVRNVGNDTARNVQVFASGLKRQQPDGTWQSVSKFPPMNLVWSNNDPWRTYLPYLPPKSSRHCDVAHIIDPKDRTKFSEDYNPDLNLAEDQASLTFDLTAKPLHKGYIVEPGSYRLTIEIAAENFDAIPRVVEIGFDGKWEPEESDMFDKKHVSIKVSLT